MKRILLIIFLFFLSSESFSQNWDINTLRKINLNRNTSLDDPFKFISNSVTPLAIGVPVTMLAVGLFKKDSITTQNAIYIGSSVIISAAISIILKESIKRSRPVETYPDIQAVIVEDGYSFPSGHTTEAFALATSMSIAYPKWYIIAPSFAWASAVGYSRMHLGVHYPTDVIAGALIGSGSAYLSLKLNEWINRKRSSRNR